MKKLVKSVIKFYHKDPCEEGTLCVVRAGCSIKTKKSDGYFRAKECPMYHRYYQRDEKLKKFFDSSVDWFWITTILSWILIIILTFFFGIWKWYELIKGLFE